MDVSMRLTIANTKETLGLINLKIKGKNLSKVSMKVWMVLSTL